MKKEVQNLLALRGLESLFNDYDYQTYKRKAKKNASGGNFGLTCIHILDMFILNSPPVCPSDC